MLVAGSLEELQKMLSDLNLESKKVDVEINLSKTKILSNANETKQIKLGEIHLDNVKSIIYLGQQNSFQNQTENEIKRRIALAWNKFWKLSFILKQKIPKQI